MAGAAAKKILMAALLAALAVGIAYPAAAWASQAIAHSKGQAPAQAGPQAPSGDDEDELLENLENLQRAAIAAPDLDELAKGTKAAKDREGRDDHRDRAKLLEEILPKLILSGRINVTNSSVANVTPGANVLLVTTGKGNNLSLILMVKGDRRVYEVRASNVSFTFSSDGSSLTLQGIITRSTLPGFAVNATITANLKIGSAAISSGSSSLGGSVISLIMHRR